MAYRMVARSQPIPPQITAAIHGKRPEAPGFPPQGPPPQPGQVPSRPPFPGMNMNVGQL